MEHCEYIRYIPGSRDAVLMIHGICGTPRHFDGLIPVIPEGISVYNILLPGHGQDVQAFSDSSMEKWRGYAEKKLELLLQRHQRIFIAAHSMGTLFAIRAAVFHPDRIPGLFLLAVPTRPLGTVFHHAHRFAGGMGRAAGGSEGMYHGKCLFCPADPEALEIRRLDPQIPGTACGDKAGAGAPAPAANADPGLPVPGG